MNHFNEYALLVAVAVPVLAIVGLNVFLRIGGERGTLLVPTTQDRLSAREEAPAAPEVTDETPAATGKSIDVPANDEQARRAA